MNSMKRMEIQIQEIVDEANDWAARNRENAKHSTGPRSPYGKSRSSSNSLKHGLTAKTVVLPGEDQAEFDALQDSLMADYNPLTEHETQLVSEIAACLWRLSRARRHEEHALASDFTLFSRHNGRNTKVSSAWSAIWAPSSGNSIAQRCAFSNSSPNGAKLRNRLGPLRSQPSKKSRK